MSLGTPTPPGLALHSMRLDRSSRFSSLRAPSNKRSSCHFRSQTSFFTAEAGSGRELAVTDRSSWSSACRASAMLRKSTASMLEESSPPTPQTLGRTAASQLADTAAAAARV